MTIGPDGKHTEFQLIKTNYSGALGGKQTPVVHRSDQLRYKPVTSFDSLKNLFNIRAIFSSIRAFLVGLFGPSHEAEEIKGRIRIINAPNAEADKVQKAAKDLVVRLNDKPMDIDITTKEKLRADSALALFNMGFLSSVVQNYADWQTEGSEKEGEVWQRAYDQLVADNLNDESKDFDPKVGALLLSCVDIRYSGSERPEHKLSIGKVLLQGNYSKALKTLNKAITAESNSLKKSQLEEARTKLETAFAHFDPNAVNYSHSDLKRQWLPLIQAVMGTPAEEDMRLGYNSLRQK